MKQFFNKIAAIFMAGVVLLSTLSFTISTHYCGDILVDTALFSKAKSCGMEMQKTSPIKGCSLQKTNCCNNVIKHIEGQNELEFNSPQFNFKQQFFLVSFANTYLNLFEELEKNVIPFKDYPPPFLVKDIQLLDEVFLI